MLPSYSLKRQLHEIPFNSIYFFLSNKDMNSEFFTALIIGKNKKRYFHLFLSERIQ